MTAKAERKKYKEKIWAVTLANTNMLSWSDDRNALEINFEHASSEAKKLSKSISIGDFVLGVKKNDLIERMGVIKKISTGPAFKISIEWTQKFLSINSPISLKNVEAGIILLPDEMGESLLSEIENEYKPERAKMDEISFEISSEYSKYDDALLSVPPRRSKMGKATVSDLSRAKKAINPKSDPGGRVRLFYGTNRKKVDNDDINEIYVNERDNLKYGICEVSIPPGHTQGNMERPFSFWFIQFSEKDEKHIVLKKVEELDESSFFTKFKEGIECAPQHDALLFIHGYNTTFAEAARRTAQIAYDVPFMGVASFFSWPSAGELLGYLFDDANADWSVSHLENFIEAILMKTGVERFHIIAHSMGNKVLSFTLKNLANKAALADKLKFIHQIILGAPDIDRGVFQKDILPAIKNIGERKTVYTSDKDIALKASEAIRKGLPRLGEAGGDLFVADGIDTIDASNVKSEPSGHGYIFDTKELLSDLFYLLKEGKAPAERRLKKRTWKENLYYWLFPE